MRRFLAVALVGLAVTAAATDASAQGRRGGRAPDSVRAARRAPDSVRAKRLDSLRAAGVIDSNRAGRRGAGMGPEGRGGRGPGGRGMGPMSGRGGLMGIQLNDNEKAAVKTINEKYRAELEQLREANKGTAPGQNPQLAAQVKAIAERQEAEVRAALTAEHQAQFDANIAKRKEMEAQMGGRRGQRPPRPPRGR